MSAGTTALVPVGVTTVTSTVPVPAGEFAEHDVAVHDTAVAATPPKLTAVAPSRLDPFTVTSVEPAAGPAAGVTELTDGPDVTGT